MNGVYTYMKYIHEIKENIAIHLNNQFIPKRYALQFLGIKNPSVKGFRATYDHNTGILCISVKHKPNIYPTNDGWARNHPLFTFSSNNLDINCLPGDTTWYSFKFI